MSIERQTRSVMGSRLGLRPRSPRAPGRCRQSGSLLIYAGLAIAGLAMISAMTYKVYRAGYDKATLECERAARAQRELEELNVSDAVKELENVRAQRKIIVRTVTRQVDKIVDRPIYSNVCLDADGVRSVNAIILSPRPNSSDTNKPMPAAGTPPGRTGQDGAEEASRDR